MKIGISNDDKETASIILIPNELCNGCISWATSQVQEEIEKANNLFVVFTGVQDMKLFKNLLSKNFLDDPRVIMDSENLFIHPDISSIYPRLIRLNKKNQIIDIQDLSSPDQLDSIYQ